MKKPVNIPAALPPKKKPRPELIEAWRNRWPIGIIVAGCGLGYALQIFGVHNTVLGVWLGGMTMSWAILAQPREGGRDG